MFGSIYTGLSGLLGFSKGLEVLSNNVANMNSPGFKASELSFRDLVYRYGFDGGNSNSNSGSSLQVGEGVDTTSTRIKFVQGNFQDTGNSLDAAIDGNGFFILRKDGNTFYTRAGQFQFNQDGALVEQGSGAHVAAFNGGRLEDISIAGLRINPPKATKVVAFSGNLSRGSTTHSVTPVTVIDSGGASHALTVNFTNNNATVSGSWLVEVKDENGNVITTTTNQIIYQGDGSPAPNSNTISFTFAPTGVAASIITLNFGDPGSFAGSTNFSAGTASDLKVQSQDGLATGALTDVTFDQSGNLTTTYSNGQVTKHQRMALAFFTDLQALTQVGQNLFTNATKQAVILDTPGNGVMGKLAPKKIELSNVQLTEQFTNLVILQRGYQASSQILSVTNEMIQQLFDLHARR